MKLTQRTLFQCFEKSRPKSPVINSSPLTPPAFESQIKTSSQQSESHIRQPDFILPVHIRQINDSLDTNVIPSFNERKINDENLFLSNEEFYRICPTIIKHQNHLPKLEFTEIFSIERQMELFEEYTADQPFINWKSIFDSLQDYRKKSIEQNQYDHLLWTEVYRPKTSETYLGNHTRQIKRLNEWFSYWTKKLHNEQPIKKRKRPLNDDDDDEDFTDNSNMSYDSYYHSKPEHPQLIFIHGCGTTSLVHALVEEHNFKMTEINGSQSRARAPLLKQLEQVTSHHQLSFKRCPSDTPMSQEQKSTPKKEIDSPLPAKKKAKSERGSITSFFSLPKKSGDEQKENQPKLRSSNKKQSKVLINHTNIPKHNEDSSDTQFFSSIQVDKTSLILFDEIETLTTDDNFWSCLKKLLETAKKPIILTSNSRTNPEDAIINLSKLGHYELIHLESNQIEFICCFLRLILLTEMLEVSSLDDLLLFIKSCSSDIRQCLLTLQFLVQSSDEKTPTTNFVEETKSSDSNRQLQSSRIFDTMYYSYLNEDFNESNLKIFFDNLTNKYTSDYEQTHLSLMNNIRNDTKRIELYDTFKFFMQEQDIVNINDQPSFYLDYRPYIRQICQYEQNRTKESNTNRRLRHSLGFRGCSLQWSDFEILSAGID